MSTALEVALVCMSLALALPVLVVFLQVLMALPKRPVAKLAAVARPRIAVLVPAHNEQSGIGKTLATIVHQLAVGDRLVVIADNCSDNTADVARQYGAEIAVRSDDARRGKGYALDHGLRFLAETSAPDIVIFVDADCQLQDDCIDRLARSSIRAMRPTQAAYLMRPPQPPRKTAALVSFAWKVKDFVRPLGWHRLGLPCQLAGSGMAFPWDVARATNLASAHLVEDMKQGLDLALIGRFPLFCPDAVVVSDVIAGTEPSYAQRARWEHGTIATMMEYLPRLVVRFCKAPTLALFGVALDICVPPLALLALALGAQFTLALILLLASGAVVPIFMSGVTCAFFVLAICLAWWRHGRDIVPFRWLALAPVYALRKIPLYGRFFFNRQHEWIGGERQVRG